MKQSIKIYTQSIKNSTQKLVCSQRQKHTYSAHIRERDGQTGRERGCVCVCVYDASTVYLCQLLVYSLQCVCFG